MNLPSAARAPALIASTIFLLFVLFVQDAIPADFIWLAMVLAWWAIVHITPGGWPCFRENVAGTAQALDSARRGEPTVGECPHCGEAVLIPAHGVQNTIRCGACGEQIANVPNETTKPTLGAGRIAMLILIGALALSGSCNIVMKWRTRELLKQLQTDQEAQHQLRQTPGDDYREWLSPEDVRKIHERSRR